MKVLMTAIIVACATVLLVSANSILIKISWTIHQNAFINGILKYQLYAFAIAILVALITLALNPESKVLLKFGTLETVAIKEKWLGINGKSTWKSNGLQLLFFISCATALFMFLGVKYTNSLGNFKPYFIPFILLISLSNSLSEELIYRFAIHGNLINIAPKMTILLVSAVLFGVPHFYGFPSGFIGVLMAGVLGYVLSKATYETGGLGIAWVIHFVQDIIIFTALFMMNVK
jgi:membrane protease YdiL (CAAX protease family)